MCDTSTISQLALGGQAAGAIGQTYSAYNKSKGEAQGYEYQSIVARNNAQLAEWQAQDALTRGVEAEGNVRLRTAQLKGTQESVIAARNVALNEGSALNILADTGFMGERDALTVRANAEREAWALREQAKSGVSNAAFLKYRADAQSPLADAAGTLLTAGGRVASGWYAMRTRSTDASGKAFSPWG